MIAEAIAIKPLRMSLGASSYLETDRFQKGYVYLEVSSYPEASASSPMNGCVRKKIFRLSQALDGRPQDCPPGCEQNKPHKSARFCRKNL